MKPSALLSLALASALALASCKTTEANYKAAYDATMAAQRNPDRFDDGLDAETRRLLAATRQSAKRNVAVGSDTLEVTTMFVSMEMGPHDRVPQYSVVLNAFSQRFNAKAMRQRLIDAGFEGAYVVRTATPDYYVAADGFNTPDSIPALLRRIEAAGNLGQRAGFPAIIRSGGWRQK